MTETRREIEFTGLREALLSTKKEPSVNHSDTSNGGCLRDNSDVDAHASNDDTLDTDLVPLSALCGYYEDEPPKGLAERTCRNIWAMVDAEKSAACDNVEIESVRLSIPLKQTDSRVPDRVMFADSIAKSIDGTVLPTTRLSVKPSTKSVTKLVDEIVSDTSNSVNDTANEILPIKNTSRVVKPGIVARSYNVTNDNDKVTPIKFPPQERRTVKVETQTRRQLSFNFMLSLSLGCILALAAFPALSFVKDTVIGFVFQRVARNIGEGYGLINQIQNVAGVPEIVEKPQGYDPKKATWHEVEYAKSELPPSFNPSLNQLPFNTVALAMQDTPPPVKIQRSTTNAVLTSSELPSEQTELVSIPSLQNVRTPSTGIPAEWLRQINGENNLLVGCSQRPEIICGQNVLIRDEHLFLRNYPIKILPIIFNSYYSSRDAENE
ncbi:MAG: hypothetical protein LBU65_13235 [Planctomycetaceae bacterium]|jgi:hypothetical protein|nr:hypothetical protein [Planctomycetaceae bacterium]